MNSNKKQNTNLIRFLKIIPDRYLAIFLATGIFILCMYMFDYALPLLQKELIDKAIATGNVLNGFFYLIIGLTAGLFLIQIFQIFLSVNFNMALERFTFKYFFERILYINKEKILRKGTDIITIPFRRMRKMLYRFLTAPYSILYSV